MRVLRSQSNRASRVAETIQARSLRRSATETRPWLARRALSIGAIAPLLLLGLASCGGKKPTVPSAQIFQTTVYRGVFADPFSFGPLLTPPRTGTINLSVVEVWD